ncbi:MAG TPA: hypothetical protein VNT99_16180 [Methylomirabilota bacterium]|nr:hypothetical protein [Methylomirabilota bacterium]
MNNLILEKLNSADEALRENLHRSDVDPIARSHMERALNHVREACIATSDIGKARTVQTMVRDLENTELLFSKIRNSHRLEAKSLKIRI